VNSLFYVLTNQHGDDFAPLRCNAQTVARLVRYFEDVVMENNLPALVIEGRCLDGEPGREGERIGRLRDNARQIYLFSCDQSCPQRTRTVVEYSNLARLEEADFHLTETGPFILVMDSRFCGLLASYRVAEGADHPGNGYEMIWTFDPNVAFTALEYLMARIGAQRPEERQRMESIVNLCTTRTSSARMALSFTTKLAMLLQRQNEMEIAINFISSAISSTLDLDTILQSAVEEVGRALKVRRAALVLWEEDSKRPEKINVYEREGESHPADPEPAAAGNGRIAQASRDLKCDHEQIGSPNGRKFNSEGIAPSSNSTEPFETPGPIEIPITFRNTVTGVFLVEDDTAGRQWEGEEIMMVRTASDQLAVAISNARLFNKFQTEAVTDAMTSLYNFRYFKDRLEREIKLADRNLAPVSLILLDLDHLKRINDTFGHRAGDEALIHIASIMKTCMREVDICARYGGEEFVVILPQCEQHNAVHAAERLRAAISRSPVPKVGRVTASVGVATYPSMASNRDELIEMADRAMYLAKASGRNLVRTLGTLE